MDIIINPMGEDDLPQVIEIENNSFADPWSLKSFQKEISENPYAIYLSAFFKNKLVAYIGGWIIIDELHITNLAVSKAFRRKGVAVKLLKELIKKSRERGAVRATLEVRVSNNPAINLYRKLGFKRAGRRPKYYSNNDEDALIMWKEYDNE